MPCDPSLRTDLVLASTFAFLLPCCTQSSPGAQAASAHQGDLAAAVKATGPLAHYRLQASTGHSELGPTTFASTGGATSASACGPSGNGCVQLDGKSGWISTTHKGGVATAGSMMAWVNLAALPSVEGHFFYIAGESQVGNDFDAQFEQDNTLRFYTAAGSHLTYTPDPASLVNRWHMVAVTADTVAHTRALYWDGAQVAHDADAGSPNKISALSIGASTAFGGRFFHGSIADVALWDRALRADEVRSLYATAKATGSGAAR
jgi:hypothetical protein